MIVVVTGASGHIGANIVRELLTQGYQVRALVHTSKKALEGLEVELVNGDILDEKSLLTSFKGADCVIHAAGYISIQNDEWELLQKVNIRGTMNVIRACQQCSVKRLVHISSIEALDRNAYPRAVDETFPPATGSGYSPYAQSKAYADELVQEAYRDGLDCVLLYPTSVIGPFDFKLGKTSQAIIDICKKRFPFLVYGSADWVDVRDVSVAAVQAITMAKAGEGYLISGKKVRLEHWVASIERIMGTSVTRVYLPLWLVNMFQPLAALYFNVLDKEPLITSVSLEALGGNWNVSHAKAFRELAYQPRAFLVTMRDTIQWLARLGLIDMKE